jgi:hypothetical protein
MKPFLLDSYTKVQSLSGLSPASNPHLLTLRQGVWETPQRAWTLLRASQDLTYSTCTLLAWSGIDSGPLLTQVVSAGFLEEACPSLAPVER